MGTSFHWKIVGVLILAVILVLAAAWFVQFYSALKSPTVVPGGSPPSGALSGKKVAPQTWNELLGTLSEEKRDCVRKALGEEEYRFAAEKPDYRISNDAKISAVNKCLWRP